MKMRLFLFFGFLLVIASSALQAQSCATQCTKLAGPKRYNAVPAQLYRHYEDVRRYNAAPNPNAYRGVRRDPFPPLSRDRVIFPRNLTASHSVSEHGACSEAVKVRSEVVSKSHRKVTTYDACGCRQKRNMIVTIYKDTYSDGRTRIWQHISYSV